MLDGEPRVRDIELAERLGFDRPSNIRNLIQRNIKEIEALGSLLRREAMIMMAVEAARQRCQERSRGTWTIAAAYGVGRYWQRRSARGSRGLAE